MRCYSVVACNVVLHLGRAHNLNDSPFCQEYMSMGNPICVLLPGAEVTRVTACIFPYLPSHTEFCIIFSSGRV